MIALVTDSNAQMPPVLTERFGVTVVPLTVTIDGVTYREGVDLDADGFYDQLETQPALSTAQPSPGDFAAAYRRAVSGGAEAILSVHIGSALSGTVNSARLAAAEVPVAVRIVDTGTASFGVALCVWAAADALAAGADLDGAAATAERTAATTGTAFVVKALDLARAGGRLDPAAADAPAIPVLTMAGGVMQVIRHVADLDGAAAAMVDHVAAHAGAGARVGVGHGDAAMAPLAGLVEARLRDLPQVREVVPYRAGPTVGAHTGPGTVGVMYAHG